MTKTRKILASLDATGYDQRHQWIEDKTITFSENIAIDVCAYAVMPNHCHVVLHINYLSLL
ncbi:hypothetical protein SIN8267_01279 [Sinobacterium norvegicum]|uniref:Transposase IS200-like domain-containing protein n=1 Tax=Sinobacterium norvegicum TaxID=1641715 RepID=A0ABM9AEQ1_9GAMM|nr:hypothetical protein [Sinobacterium norvegicum]CAH0991177.1 hypothetical protein SIN8267_01279 [Sinobacterium norvegicum]